ncbi:MAG TPA: PDZ domain-containing protein [Kofleriaceae bacterium]|jgi:S1-C subfamily serine protease
MSRAEDHVISVGDIQSIMTGRDGSDLVADLGRTGMRLVDVTPGSIAERLGGKNGDIIESINGVPLATVAKGYEAAYAAIKARRIVLAGHRDKEPFTITLTIDAA